MGSAPQRLGQSWLQQELRGGWGAQPVCQCDCNGSGEGGGHPACCPSRHSHSRVGSQSCTPWPVAPLHPQGRAVGGQCHGGGEGKGRGGICCLFFF